MRAEFGALFVDLGQLCEAEDLKPTAVGQHRLVPAHEFWQSAHFGHDVFTGTQVKMIGVAQDNLSTGRIQKPRGEPFDGSASAHRHKRRQINYASGRRQTTQSSVTMFVLVKQFKFESRFVHG